MKRDCVRGIERSTGCATLLALGGVLVACSSSEAGNNGPGPDYATAGMPPVGAGAAAPLGAGGMLVAPGAGGDVGMPPLGAGGTVPPAGAGGSTPLGAGGESTAGSGGLPPAAGGAPPGAGGDGSQGGAATTGLPAVPCGLNTGYEGDDRCIMPPPPDQGFQVHVGPTNYDNPEREYVLQPGEERTTDFTVTSDNDQDIYFFARQYRLRPTAHHMIMTTSNGATGLEIATGRRIGTANHSGDFPASGVEAPEDEGVGIPLKAHSRINVSFHTINTTSSPQLREMWVNFWYKDASKVTQPAVEWFETGSVTFAIPPYAKTTLGPFSCTVSGQGRLLWLYGHRHANNTRFTVSRIRGFQRDVIYDADRWDEPLVLEYSSAVQNPAPDLAAGIEGGWSGILDLQAGDRIEWSCDVANQQNATLRFTNNTYTGEMCIVDAEAVGASCN